MYKTAEEVLENKTLKQVKRPNVRYLVNGAIDPMAGNAILIKGSAGAHTLAAPTAKQEGLELRIVAGSAYAHVVTATGLLDDGVIGGAKNTVTMGAYVGASVTLLAVNLKWVVVSKNVATTA